MDQGDTKLTDGDISIRTLNHFVHGAKRSPKDSCNRFGSHDVGFLSIQTTDPRFLLLFFDDDERPPELVERERPFCMSLTLWGSVSECNEK